MVRGSSIMKVMSWRMMARNSSSIAASSPATRAAAAASRRAKASSERRSMPIAISDRCPIGTRRGRVVVPLVWMSRAMRAILVASSPMRSRSVTILETARIRRRSEAAGWRRTMIWPRSLSIASSSSFTLESAAITCWARSTSPSR